MKATTTQRTDLHRPSVIEPTEYEHVLEFGVIFSEIGWDGERIEETEGVEEALLIYEEDGAYIHGDRDSSSAIFRCDICGAGFKFGSLFQHSSGEVISVGHDCADTMNLAYDVLKASSIRERAKRARLATARRLARFHGLRCWAEENRDLLPALRCKHYIVRNIRARLIEKCWKYDGLSEKQIALVKKLYAEEQESGDKEEVMVPAPIAKGRQAVEGEIVSCKLRKIEYGDCYKITVKVEEEEGCWLAWGTLPGVIEGCYGREFANTPQRDRESIQKWLRGKRIRFEAKLRVGDKEYFAFYSRPTKAELLG